MAEEGTTVEEGGLITPDYLIERLTRELDAEIVQVRP